MLCICNAKQNRKIKENKHALYIWLCGILLISLLKAVGWPIVVNVCHVSLVKRFLLDNHATSSFFVHKQKNNMLLEKFVVHIMIHYIQNYCICVIWCESQTMGYTVLLFKSSRNDNNNVSIRGVWIKFSGSNCTRNV